MLARSSYGRTLNSWRRSSHERLGGDTDLTRNEWRERRPISQQPIEVSTLARGCSAIMRIVAGSQGPTAFRVEKLRALSTTTHVGN